MNVQELLNKQSEFDKLHGWDISNIPEKEGIEALEKDLVGLIGEVGEVANLIKRARLASGKQKSPSNAFLEIIKDLNEELTDVFIYLLRMFTITKADIEEEFFKKMKINQTRFKNYEKSSD